MDEAGQEQEPDQLQEPGRTGRWAIWIVFPVCIAATVVVTKWALTDKKGLSSDMAEEYSTGPAETREIAGRPALPVFNPVEDRGGGSSLTAPAAPKRDDGTGRTPEAAPAAAPKPAESAEDPRTAGKQRALGGTYGALSAAAAKMLSNPDAITAMLSNEYVIAGFMSRGTVKSANASKASLAAYLKNPANVSAFLKKPAVQRGLNDPALIQALANSGLANAMFNTPSAKALLNDPAAVSAVFAANPELMGLMMNPDILNAMMSNPKLAVALSGVNPAGATMGR